LYAYAPRKNYLHPIFSYRGKKTFFSLEICSERFFFLTVIILAINLYTRFHKEIGLNSLKETKMVILGMRYIKVAFNAPITLPEVLYSSTTFHKSIPTLSKKSKENFTNYPSSPRFLDLEKLDNLFLTSSRVILSNSLSLLNIEESLVILNDIKLV